MSSEEETTSPNTDNLHFAAFIIQHHMGAYRRLRHTVRIIDGPWCTAFVPPSSTVLIDYCIIYSLTLYKKPCPQRWRPRRYPMARRKLGWRMEVLGRATQRHRPSRYLVSR